MLWRTLNVIFTCANSESITFQPRLNLLEICIMEDDEASLGYACYGSMIMEAGQGKSMYCWIVKYIVRIIVVVKHGDCT